MTTTADDDDDRPNAEDGFEAPRLLWTSAEAAGALAISERVLWNLSSAGEIPPIRIGRSVRFAPADVQAWIERQRAAARKREA